MNTLLARMFRLVVGTGAFLSSCIGFAAAPEHADIMVQGGGGVYAADGATLVRQPDGIKAGMRLPTPSPGSYVYPAGRVEGHPEVFTVWGFIFNFPELCDGACDSNDLGDTLAQGGAYNVGGHAVGHGQYMNVTGRIAVGEEPFAGAPLVNPAGAEVHLALAPHGALDPATLPGEFRSPTGPSSLWWVGVFVP